jgi:hypothetical protein
MNDLDIVVPEAKRKKKRWPTDSVLNELAATLKDAPIHQPLDQFEIDHAMASLEAFGKLRYVSLLPGMRNWAVRYPVGGVPRHFGIVPGSHSAAMLAARFADLVQWHFWRFRIRGAHPPAEANLNFSLKRVQSDYDNEKGLFDLLIRIEEHLRTIGLIQPANVVEEQRKKDRQRREIVRTKHHEFIFALEAQREAFNALTERIAALEKKLA